MKDEDHGTSSACPFVRGGNRRRLRGGVDRVWPNACQKPVRWFVSGSVQRVVCEQLRDGIRGIFRGEWCHYRDRARSGRWNRRFFRRGDFQRFTRGGARHLQVYWCFPVVNPRTAKRSCYGFVVVYRVGANRKGHVECRSTLDRKSVV